MLARLRSVAACGPLWRGRAVQLEQLVTELVLSGRYRSAGEVVREGLRLPAVRDESDRAKLEALRRMIQEGIDSGPAAPLDMDEVIATASPLRSAAAEQQLPFELQVPNVETRAAMEEARAMTRVNQ